MLKKLAPALAAAFLAWIASTYIHYPTLPDSLYSDAVSFWDRRELAAGLRPCIDFFFEYPPAACFITYMSRVLGGASREGYYMVFALMSLPAFLTIGWYMGRVAGLPATALTLAPTMILYGVYNYDQFLAMLMVMALALYNKGRKGVSYVLLGVGASVKLLTILLLPALLMDRFRWRYILFFFVGTLPAILPVIALNPGYISSFINYHASWGLENAWTVWLAPNPFSPSAKILGWLVAFTLIGRSLILRRYVSVEERCFLILSGFLLGSSTFTPQMVVMLLPLLASIPSVWPIIPLLEASNAGIILTWFWVENPTNPWTLPQTMALLRAAGLATAWAVVYRGWSLLKPLQQGLYTLSLRRGLRLRSSR